MKWSLCLWVVLAGWLSGCTGVPVGVEPVNNLDLQRYLGQWYEVARLDHSFERGLSRVSAEYRLREDGGVQVINRGFSEEEGQWRVAEGRAYPVQGEQVGHYKVSFFGPFYGSYVIFKLDPEYRYAYVTGYNKSYLWLLSRTPNVPDSVRQDFVETAKALGYPVGELIFVSQQPADSE